LLEIAPLSETNQENLIRRHQPAFKIAAQTEVMAGLTELRDLQALSPRDGQSSDTDKGMDAYSRAHHNPCPAVPPLTDAARLRLATEAQRRRDEAQVAEDKQGQEKEAARQAADKLAHEEAETVRKAKETQEEQAAAAKLAPRSFETTSRKCCRGQTVPCHSRQCQDGSRRSRQGTGHMDQGQ
jgi:hypothetical protein